MPIRLLSIVHMTSISYLNLPDLSIWFGLSIAAISTLSAASLLIRLRPVDQRERHPVENALRSDAERFRAIFEQSAVGMAETDLLGNYLRVNQRFCEFVGYSQAELLTLSFQQLTHPDDSVLDEACERELLSSQMSSYFMEKRYLTKDGQVRWANVSVSLIRSEGSPTCTVASIEDIDSRKQVEAALRQSEAKNRAIISAIPDLLICMDGRGNYLEVVEAQTVRILNPNGGFDDKNLLMFCP